jgi:hypothetical protein
VADKPATLTVMDRLTPLKRFTYPLLVVLLLALALTGWPLPVFLAGWPLILVIGLGLLALTFYWFDKVGPHLHEREWQKLATELNLAFEPRGLEDGKEVGARVAGQYQGHQVSLESFRLANKRDGRESFFMHCSVSTKAPVGTNLALHSLNKDDKKGQPPQTGDSKFDSRFHLDEAQPASLPQTLFASPAIRKQLLAFAHRPIWLRLKDGQLIYQDQRSQFLGVEMDRQKLKTLLNTLIQTATTLESQP